MNSKSNPPTQPGSVERLQELLANLRASHPAATGSHMAKMGAGPMLLNPDGPAAATLIKQLQDELIEARNGQWQPIETAPQDGLALVCGHWGTGDPWWNIGSCSDVGIYGDWEDELEPEAWMQLPDPPTFIDKSQ